MSHLIPILIYLNFKIHEGCIIFCFVGLLFLGTKYYEGWKFVLMIQIKTNKEINESKSVATENSLNFLQTFLAFGLWWNSCGTQLRRIHECGSLFY